MNTTLNLAQKIHAAKRLLISGEVQAPRKARVGTGEFSYEAYLADAVIETANTLCDKVGIILIPGRCLETSHNNFEIKNNKGIVKMQYEVHIVAQYIVINADNPEDRFVIEVPAMSLDSGDKAINKAMTYALKYTVLQLFGLQDGFDGDREVSENHRKVSKAVAPQPITFEQLVAKFNSIDNHDKINSSKEWLSKQTRFSEDEKIHLEEILEQKSNELISKEFNNPDHI